MNRSAIALKLSEKLGMNKQVAEETIKTIETIITDELVRGGEATLAGFGTFSSRVRAARKGVNPRNPKESIDVPEVRVPKFKSGKNLKDALKKKA